MSARGEDEKPSKLPQNNMGDRSDPYRASGSQRDDLSARRMDLKRGSNLSSVEIGEAKNSIAPSARSMIPAQETLVIGKL